MKAHLNHVKRCSVINSIQKGKAFYFSPEGAIPAQSEEGRGGLQARPRPGGPAAAGGLRALGQRLRLHTLPQLLLYHLPHPWHPAPTGRCKGAKTLALGQRETPISEIPPGGSLQQVIESSSKKYKRAPQLSLRQTENATGTTSAQTNCWNTPHDTKQA